MRLPDENIFYDEEALLERLTDGVRESGREVVFVVGAPLTAPVGAIRGVSNVAGVTELIRNEFKSKPEHVEKLDALLAISENKYQEAFKYLIGRRGQDASNKIVRSAVFNAWQEDLNNGFGDQVSRWKDSDFYQFENKIESWSLTPGVNALGDLIARKSNVFGGLVITSNFDPLIEISIKKAGGTAWRTAMHSDGSINQSRAQGCQVVHIHGYWFGSDTLHTGKQLLQSRPALTNSILSYVEDKIVVVIAYGGWEDIFTRALNGIVDNSEAYPEIIWAFFDKSPTLSEYQLKILQSGLNRGRVTLYSGIDCHKFLPKLTDNWLGDDKSGDELEALPGTIRGGGAVNTEDSENIKHSSRILRRFECDRPPAIDAWVGREQEIANLLASSAKVVSICGFGGEGKSALAAQYLLYVERGETKFEYWDWRDCKEEGNRLRTQILDAIYRISGGIINPSALASADDDDLIDIFVDESVKSPGVFIFDNVDQYVDLENSVFVGILDRLVRSFSRSATNSRIVITCRPKIAYDSSSMITISLKGLSLREAVDLFEKRVGKNIVPKQDIEGARGVTEGHAFWLDLLAVQVARGGGVSLKNLLEDMRRGRGGEAPDVLSSIWDSLSDRERIVLRVMAEITRPENEETLFGIISAEINFQRFRKSLKSLININLIVVKPEANSPDLFDLHPLVRQFVKKKFVRTERVGYITSVIKQYTNMLSNFQSLLGVYTPFNVLERWTQRCELEIEAGFYDDAFNTLIEIKSAIIGSGHAEEYIRVAKKLFENVDWAVASQKNAKFDSVLINLIHCLDHFGEHDDADDLFKKFEATIPYKTARYILYCDAKCHSEWRRGEFESAVDWGARGSNLKQDSNVDTDYDCGHSLALAKRDGGEPEEALIYFAEPFDVSDLTDPKSESGIDDGPLLGNVGRCLQLIGRIDDALICFHKSARTLEDDVSVSRIDNQAYAREWIGQIYERVKKYELAMAFYVEAETLLLKFSPRRAKLISERICQLEFDSLQKPPSERAARRVVDRWIYTPTPQIFDRY